MSPTTDPVLPKAEAAHNTAAPAASTGPSIGPATGSISGSGSAAGSGSGSGADAGPAHGPSAEPALDRYVSFIGMDCDAKAATLVAGLRAAMTGEGRTDPFWDYFVAKLDGHNGPRHDELYQVHCHLNDLRDLAERWDQTALADLIDTLEVDCC